MMKKKEIFCESIKKEVWQSVAMHSISHRYPENDGMETKRWQRVLQIISGKSFHNLYEQHSRIRASIFECDSFSIETRTLKTKIASKNWWLEKIVITRAKIC